MDALNSIVGYGEEKCSQQAQSPSLLQTLKRKQMSLNQQLIDVTKAVEALEKNPQVAEVLELVARAR